MKKVKNKNNFNTKNGYVMLITAIVFMMVSFTIIFGLATPIIKQVLISRDIWGAKQSYFLSEAGVEDVIYRLKDATYTSYVGSSESITLNGYGATTTFSGSLGGINGITITTLSDNGGYDKTLEAKVKNGSGVSFTYGVQVGQGGFTMTGSSGIVGNIFSGGDIIGCGSCYITGSAIIANGSMIEDQSNDTPTSSPNSIIFGDALATQDVAESFQISTSSPIMQISLYMKKTGTPASVTVKIVKNSGGSPSSVAGDVVASGALDSALVTTSYDWVDVALSPNPTLTLGTTYWIVIDAPTGSASNKYTVGANLDTSYSLGTAKTGSLGGSWNNAGYDMYFRIGLGDTFSKILGGGQYNQLSIGTTATDLVWAHNVSYVKSTGPIRCQNELFNNKACDQTYDDPSPASYPVSSGNITEWEDEATAGGSVSGYSHTDATPVSLGPKKIVGDMHIGGSVTMTVNGTLYVTGNLTLDGSGKIQLASSYGTNSGIIVVDGKVVIGGSAKATGSGQAGSYIMIVSNSTCPTGGSCSSSPAIDMSGSGGAVILNAQKGTINFSGSANANEATANAITMSGSTVITYQTGIVNANFSTGPSGGFNISSWREVEN